MQLKTLCALFYFLIILSSCNQVNELNNASVQQCIDIADQRNTAQLIELLNAQDAKVVEMAALKLGSVQDEMALPYLMQLAEDAAQSNAIRINAIFAIGQTDKSGSMNQNIAALIKTEYKNFDLREASIIALGKTSKYFEDYSPDFFPVKTNEVAVAKGALYHTMHSRTGTKLLNLLLDSILTTNNEEAKLYAANTLARNQIEIDLCDKIFDLQAIEKDGNVRYFLLNACKNCSLSDEQIATLSEIAQGTNDLLKIGIARALKQNKNDRALSVLEQLILSPNKHVQETAAISISNIGTDQAKRLAKQLLIKKNTLYFEAQKQLYTTLLKNADNEFADSLSGIIAQKFYDATDEYEKASLLTALGAHWSNFTWLQTEAFSTESILIRLAAINGVISIRKHPDFLKFDQAWKTNNSKATSLVQEMNKTLSDAIKTYDVSLCAVVSELLLDTSIVRDPANQNKNYSISINDTSIFTQAKIRMKLPRDIETYQLLSAVSAKYAGKSFKRGLKPAFNNPIDWEFVNRIPYNQKIKFNTNKGSFTVKLNVNEAPGTVGQILKFVQDGYFIGKFFHRVVPGFVMQGGCPRGDGYGGTMQTIRSEFGKLNYSKAGMVGMASAGPDTESCQFFVTLAPTPHLDGRYTIFGEIIAGFDVIQQIVIGDRIIETEILP